MAKVMMFCISCARLHAAWQPVAESAELETLKRIVAAHGTRPLIKGEGGGWSSRSCLYCSANVNRIG